MVKGGLDPFFMPSYFNLLLKEMTKPISIKDKLLKGSAWAFGGKLIAVFTGIGVNALIARLLTPDEMGTYFLLFSLVSIMAVVAQLGLTQTVVRLVAESIGTDRPCRARRMVVLSLRITALSGVMVACLLAFGLGEWIALHLFDSIIMSRLMGLVAVWTVIIAFQQLLAEIHRGFHDIRLATIFGGLATSFLSMLLFFGLWSLSGTKNLEQIILMTLAAGLSSLLLSSLFLWLKLKQLPKSLKVITTTEILNISWPLWLTNLTLFALTQSGLWILGAFGSPDEVAIYGAATRVVTLVAMPLLIVNAVVPPLIAEMYAQDKTKKLEQSLRMLATVAGVPSALILGFFMIFGSPVLSLLFGPYYQAGSMVLTILSIGQLSNVWTGSCGLTLMLTGHQFTMMVISVFCGILTVAMAWWLVAEHGSLGIAIATSTGMASQNLLMVLYTKQKTGIWTQVDLFLIKKWRRILWKRK